MYYFKFILREVNAFIQELTELNNDENLRAEEKTGR